MTTWEKAEEAGLVRMRNGFRYVTETDRHMVTCPVVETSGAAMELTGNIWEQAAKLLAA